VLRTHVLRPTWHAVAPGDIRWLLELTAPRVRAAMAYYDRLLELDDTVYTRSNAALTAALQGGRQLTRAELATALQRAGIESGNLQRLGHLLMRAELDAIVCSGARRGKQHTYALLDERAPQAKRLVRDEALAELAGRYFASHGPATLKDYVWWSGLTAADAKAGLEMIRPRLACDALGGETYYWHAATVPATQSPSPTVYLLPNYDEYLVGYADRGAVFDASWTSALGPRGNILFNHTIIVNGRVAGIWKRGVRKGTAVVTVQPFAPLGATELGAVGGAAGRYGSFLALPMTVELDRAGS
jgi:hypothetical protein